MENKAMKDYAIHNGKLFSTSEIDLFSEIKNSNIYEVIRVIDGEPLYLEEHLHRLRKSSKLVGIKVDKKNSEIIKEIYELIEKNNSPNMNIKILCTFTKDSMKSFYLYFIKSFYPPSSQYLEGIHTILFQSERDNPNAKTSNIELRRRIDKKREIEHAFEALLVNNKGQITEGSRSNLFFVKNNEIYTPPSNKVLLGVTRTKIVELCSRNDIKIIEKNISIGELCNWDGAFITGTSINVLPIKSIDEVKVNSVNNDVIIKLIEIYEKDMKNYIAKRKLPS